MPDTSETGYKGFVLQPSQQTGSYHLVSPTGVTVAVFQHFMGSTKPGIVSLIDGLDCGQGDDHATEEHAIRHIVDQYERLTTTAWERFRRRISGFFSHGGWGAVAAVAAIIGAVAAIIAATVGILTYINTVAQ